MSRVAVTAPSGSHQHRHHLSQRLRESHGPYWWSEYTRRSAYDAGARRAKVAEVKLKEIVDLERLQTGGAMPMNKERLDMVPLLEYTVQALMPHAEEKAIQIQSDIEVDSIIAEADRQQMERVFQNLISNAIKYTPKEGQVFVSASTNDGAAVIHIRDTGYGIPEDELPYIFDRFRRVAKHEKKAADTGLGLAITKALVEAHDGDITVTSQEGVGSTFTISLPVRIAV
jgi:signal transduction histidine kinase